MRKGGAQIPAEGTQGGREAGKDGRSPSSQPNGSVDKNARPASLVTSVNG